MAPTRWSVVVEIWDKGQLKLKGLCDGLLASFNQALLEYRLERLLAGCALVCQPSPSADKRLMTDAPPSSDKAESTDRTVSKTGTLQMNQLV